ncbi:hypothetical protein H6G89_18650 [Oscillatoria sp. FACHB-1407]|uniref:Acg family FMN-binding oxidoreductase n=1 Tax=Oscillatoria sp. FACHB-1407 TaxID=2692847 RepID=UPI0016848051|nr:hypothetical protein [Oscillatoria sp. FACHB-1407]MBD2463060.1 hypothetical protein [Oscillatoria sp. FACHB-1407]
MKKRTFLKLMSATTVTVLVAGGVYQAHGKGVFSTGKGPAYEPWHTWRTDEPEGSLALVRAAILAANPHNTQPWLFQVTESQIELYADISRHLGTMDPYFREMYIGLGCAIENMILAASANGYQYQLTLGSGTLTDLPPNAKLKRVATLKLSSGPVVIPPLYDAIPNRHTNRAVYDSNRSVESEVLETFQALFQSESDLKLFLFTSEAARHRFAAGTVRATEQIVADADMIHDSGRWFRPTWQELQKHRSGVHIDASGMTAMNRALAKVSPPISEETAHQAWIDATKITLASTPVLGLISVRDLYDQSQSLKAGQLWQRMHLWATTQGLAAQPINQLPEMVDRELQLGEEPRTAQFLAQLSGDPLWKPTFAFRLGYPTLEGLVSARRPVEDVVV